MNKVLLPWIVIVFLSLGAYYTALVLNTPYSPYNPYDLWYYIYWGSPWALLIVSLWAWYRCFIWRRMMARQSPSSSFSRTEISIHLSSPRPGMLERLCALCVLLALAAILKQFGVRDIGWWVGGLMVGWYALRLMFKRMASS